MFINFYILENYFSFSKLLVKGIGEGNGNPLQYSSLENPRDGGAWWAPIYGVAQSWTRLNQLGSNSSSKDAPSFQTLYSLRSIDSSGECSMNVDGQACFYSE